MHYRVLLFFTFLSAAAFSQSADTLALPPETEGYFRFMYENDFFSATDRYYTQGIQVVFIHKLVKYSPLSKTLIPLGKNSRNYYGIQAEQDCFTPRSIRHEEIFYGERPFCATAFVSHSLRSLDPVKKQSLNTQLDIGGLGPCARCEDEQKAIHKALVNIYPLGWEHQIRNDVILNYRASFEKGIVNTRSFELMGITAARLGTLYTDLGLGIHARFGKMNPYFNNLGLSKSPWKKKSNHKFSAYAFLKANGRLVGYNASLQGGLFNRTSVYTVSPGNVSRVVIDGMGGVVMAYKRVSLEYSKAYITPEFKGGFDHGWGRCVITVCF
jgi:lipid A 3-O-deacylase